MGRRLALLIGAAVIGGAALLLLPKLLGEGGGKRPSVPLPRKIPRRRPRKPRAPPHVSIQSLFVLPWCFRETPLDIAIHCDTAVRDPAVALFYEDGPAPITVVLNNRRVAMGIGDVARFVVLGSFGPCTTKRLDGYIIFESDGLYSFELWAGYAEGTRLVVTDRLRFFVHARALPPRRGPIKPIWGV